MNNNVSDKKKKSRIIPLVVSLIVAFGLWFYVMAAESPVNEKEFSLVPIKIEQGDGTLSVYSGGGATVELTVSGKKSVLNQLTIDDFQVVADISTYTTAGRYTVPLEFILPDGATKVSSSIDSLSLYLDGKTSKNVPVVVNLVDYTLSDGMYIDDKNIEKSANEVVVNGPSSIVNDIENARVNASLGNVTGSLSLSSSVNLVDSNGSIVSNPYVSTDIEDIELRIPVYMETELPLSVSYKYGYFNDDNVSISIVPDSMNVKGETETLKKLDTINIATLDETLIDEGKTTMAIVLPDGIESSDDIKSVDLNIKFKNTATKQVQVTEFDIKNSNSDEKYSAITESLTIELRGDKEEIEKVTEKDITVSVDMSSVKSNQKTINAIATVSVNDKYSNKVYAIGEYSIQLKKS